MISLLEILSEKNIGYHVGGINTPAESLKSRSWYFGNKVGYMGTGFYYFGSLVDAKNLQKQLKGPMYMIDLSDYRLYTPTNPSLFYQDIKQITQALGNIEKKSLGTPELKESLEEIADIFINEHGISIEKSKLVAILNGFIQDVIEKKEGTLLSNRLLEPLGYEGIDNRSVYELDHYGVGSLLFYIKPGTAKQI